MTSRVHRSCARARLLRYLTPYQVAAMALLCYFQVTAFLPTAEDTTLGDTVTQSANAAVLREVQAEWPRKRKAYTVFTAEQRATIGKYASEHRNAANPDIVKNGFKKAGITEALETGLPEADAELDLQDLSENDPFSSDSD